MDYLKNTLVQKRFDSWCGHFLNAQKSRKHNESYCLLGMILLNTPHKWMKGLENISFLLKIMLLYQNPALSGSLKYTVETIYERSHSGTEGSK